MIPAIDIASMIFAFGGEPIERDTLVAIAWSESKYDENAVGDGGWSHGLFQAERNPGVPVKKQIYNALQRLREQRKYFENQLKSLSDYVDCSQEMILRYHRAAWQTHPKMPSNWLSWINNQIFDLQEQHERLGFQLTNDDILEAISGKRKKLDVWDMIKWAGERNVNSNALSEGQNQITRYLSGNKIASFSEAGFGLKKFMIVLAGITLWYILKR